MPEVRDETKTMFDLVNDELTTNLQAFMDSLPKLTSKLGRFLEATKTLNPKSGKRNAVTGPLSPLLKCRKASMEEIQREDSLLSQEPGLVTPKNRSMKANNDQPAEEQLEAIAYSQNNSVKELMNNNSFRFEDKELEKCANASDLPALPEDPHLVQNMDALTCEAYELRIVLSGICDWIEMQMPAIKLEGDNRGVAVQEAVIRHLVHMRTAVQTINERQRSYTDKIAEYATKYYKNPHAARHWAQAVILWNGDHWDQLERDWRELRQVVILAGRLLSLNMEKLTTPRQGPPSHFMHM